MFKLIVSHSANSDLIAVVVTFKINDGFTFTCADVQYINLDSFKPKGSILS